MGHLRALTVSQQIGLLFVVLFGLLALVTAIAVSRSVRERSPEAQERFDRGMRDLRALWWGGVLF